ncbi:flagellar biosynthesis anti-sigma factor FlgM [Peribacillus sp. SCS-155]|uniref:flagellar biosynthesis anti-sigma factor FlgM n=1 Tax=Peribacillus sedimenti TaxID=3115297 RepID=UPI003905951E
MKINNFGPSGINPYNRQLNKVHKSNATSVNKADKLEISTAAKELQQSTQIPAERQAKVEALKLQVENGTYKLNSKETAKGIVDFYLKK